MIGSIRKKIDRFLSRGEERTILAKKNIAASFVTKAVTILISFIMVPLTIGYVNEERNGIWLTLSSMVAWMVLFDIGFGNGLKNKFAEAKARGELLLAKKYVSSTYAIIIILWAVIFTLFALINPYLDWMKIIPSTPPEYAKELNDLVWICVSAFGFTFVLRLLGSIVTADQRPAIAAFIDMLGQLLSLLGIFILVKTTPASLPKLGFVLAFSPVVVYLIYSLILFNSRYKNVRPSWKYIDFSLGKQMLNLGVKFFITACAAFIIAGTLNFLVAYMVDSAEVTRYNTAFRLFSLAFNVMTIIIMPYWSSFTDAYTLKDYAWMKSSVRQLYRIFLVFLVVQVIVLALSPLIYYLWVDAWLEKALNIPFAISFAVFLYVCILCWTSMCIYPINGIGKIQLQLYSSVAEMILLFPLAFFLGGRFGTVGIILTPVIIYLPRTIWAPVQLNKLLNNTATGIWNK